MKATEVPEIAGAFLFEPTPYADERGFFCRTFDADVVRSVGLDPDAFVQDSLSRSVRGVLRGLHLRSGAGEAKLVRCSYGRIFDVVVDLRPDGVFIGQFNGAAAGQTVPHVHFHVIPRWEGQPLRMHARDVADADTLEALAKRIRSHWRAD